MSLLYSQTATATVTGGTNSVAISGMDLSAVVAGMTIHLGARDRVKGDGLIISTIAPTGSSGGTIKTVGNVDTTFTSAPFVIDTRDYNGTASNYALSALSQVLNALLKLTSPLTTLFAGSRILALDKDTPSAVSRLLYAIAGRPWGALEQRSVTFTPTGAQAPTTIEALSVRAFPDGSTPAEAITVDLTTGGVDVQVALTGMTLAPVLDLGSAPIARVAVYGTGTISSFGAGRNKVRDLIFISAGVTLKHSDSLSLPSLADIVTQSGDTLRAMSDSAGNWRVHSYQRIDGRALTIDPDLEAIAALTTQPYGRGLLTESSAAGVRGNIGVNQTAGFAAEGTLSDFPTNGSFFNAVAIDFTAAGTKMLGYGAIDFTNKSGLATDVQARLLLVNMTAGGTTVASGRTQRITLPPDIYTGSGTLNPMLQVNGLTLGATYRLQLQILRSQANGPIQALDIHIGGLSV